MNPTVFRRARYACYLNSIGMSVIALLSPFLFVTFHSLYDISYTRLGLLVLINFCSQLSMDLIFSFFAHRFNLKLALRCTPLLMLLGLLIYAVLPPLFPRHAYAWLAVGTVVFSVAAGLGEVLNSPFIAAIPSDNPEREMSKLHSLYAWGVVGFVVISTVLLRLFGAQNWPYLALFWCLVPLCDILLFIGADLPSPPVASPSGKAFSVPLTTVLPFALCIFFGGAAEQAMTQWCSGYVETALGISKTLGDLFGIALFAVMLGLGRSLYARFGKNIASVLTVCFGCATVTYLIAGLAPHPILGLLACILTGFCVSMLWPGTLIYTEQCHPNCSVGIYALLAAGGDLGGSVAPQLLGWITDRVSESQLAGIWPSSSLLTADQIGLKVGMLVSVVFPLLGLIVVFRLRRRNASHT